MPATVYIRIAATPPWSLAPRRRLGVDDAGLAELELDGGQWRCQRATEVLSGGGARPAPIPENPTQDWAAR